MRGAARAPAGRGERLGERRVDRALALARPAHLARREREVRAREAAHDLRRIGRQAEPRQDLVAHDRRRGGRAGEHARAGQLREQRADPRYSGRKSWPHSLMQCASSIATSGQASRRSRPRKPGEASRSGAT